MLIHHPQEERESKGTLETEVSNQASDEQWYCIQTKSHCEDLASIGLFSRQITVFNPKIEEFYVREGRRCKRIAPLFPSYIFASLTLAQDYPKVKWTPGVKKIVGNGDRPIPVGDSAIHTILDRLETEEYIKLKELKSGDKVVIGTGPFSGLIGIFESYCPGKERVKVLLDLLHQQVDVEMDYALIRKL